MMAACSPSGEEQHRALLSAVHFATKMVSATVHVANVSAQQLREHAALEAAEAARAEQATLGGAPAQQTLPEGVGTYLGSAGCFTRPSLTLHLLDNLETRLEQHGSHAFMLPVLAVHREFCRSIFPAAGDEEERGTEKSASQAPLHETAMALVDLRLSRIAQLCNLSDTAQAAWARVEQLLPELPKQFPAFEEELEQARVQRGTAKQGAWAAEKVLHPFVVNDIRPHEMWTVIAEELFARGENTTCAVYVAEARRHAEVYEDLRALRRLALLQAKIARAEG